MIYIICTIKANDYEITKYRIFETLSESVMLIKPNTLKKIMQDTKIEVVNARIQNDNIVIKDWGKGQTIQQPKIKGSNDFIQTGPKYTLISKTVSSYKIARYNGSYSDMLSEEFKTSIDPKDIANYNTLIGPIDIQNIQKDEEFNSYIEEKYKIFKAKTNILGYKDTSFEYVIESREVKLSKYTGSNKDIILPSFITAIYDYALSSRRIENIRLNEGIRVIGSNAFSFNLIERIEIPETMELIGVEAFYGNAKLSKDNGDILYTDRFKLRSNKTIVLERADKV